MSAAQICNSGTRWSVSTSSPEIPNSKKPKRNYHYVPYMHRVHRILPTATLHHPRCRFSSKQARQSGCQVRILSTYFLPECATGFCARRYALRRFTGGSWRAVILQHGDFSGRIPCWHCNCPASINESSYGAKFQRALELGVSESQLKRGGSVIAIGKKKLLRPLFPLADVQNDTCDGSFQDGDFGSGVKSVTSNGHAARPNENKRTGGETSPLLLAAFGGGLSITMARTPQTLSIRLASP